MFSDPSNRPGGEGGGGMSQKVLLVLNKKRRRKEIFPPGKISKFAAVGIISEIATTSSEKVERVLAESLKDQAKKVICDGEAEIINVMALKLNKVFCEEEIEFYSEFP